VSDSANKIAVSPARTDVHDGEQLGLFDPGEAKRTRPTEEELLRVVQWAAKMRIYKDYRGRPPRGWDWNDLQQEVIQRTLEKMRNFLHGGPKTITEFAAMAAFQALMDICREHMIQNEEPRIYPLLEQESA
jgi:hypothetical protein